MRNRWSHNILPDQEIGTIGKILQKERFDHLSVMLSIPTVPKGLKLEVETSSRIRRKTRIVRVSLKRGRTSNTF